MAGHSKWANIKHRKAAQDKKKSKAATICLKQITVAARISGDPESNPRLRLAMNAARSYNIAKDTIERAIKRGTGELGGANLEEIVYEGYGPGGVAVMVDCLSDNRNRTVAEVRHAFTKSGGNLGTDGSVSYLFNKQGLITFDPGANEEKIMEVALEAGAEDISTNDDGSVEVLTAWDQLDEVNNAMEAAGLEANSAEVAMIASTEIEVDRDTAEKLLRLLDMLEDLDDVQNVHSNANIPDEILEELS